MGACDSLLAFSGTREREISHQGSEMAFESIDAPAHLGGDEKDSSLYDKFEVKRDKKECALENARKR